LPDLHVLAWTRLRAEPLAARVHRGGGAEGTRPEQLGYQVFAGGHLGVFRRLCWIAASGQALDLGVVVCVEKQRRRTALCDAAVSGRRQYAVQSRTPAIVRSLCG
jgi:hypothetical protein